MISFFKKLLNFLFSRLFVVAVMVLVQAFIIIALILHFQNALFLYSLLNVISFLAVLGVVSNHENPSYKLTWIISIMLFPLTGGVFYMLLGNKRIPKDFKRHVENAANVTREFHGENLVCQRLLEPQCEDLATISHYIHNIAGYTAYSGTSSRYFPSTESAFEVLLEELKKAERFIFLEFFIIRPGKMWNSVLEILREKAAAGVEIKLIYDDMGCINTLPSCYDEALRGFGIEVVVFNPFRPRISSIANYRDHRKIVVIDGNIAFSGGYNMGDEYINELERFGHWKDTGFVIEGDGVWSFTFMFLQQWQFSTLGNEPLNFDLYRPTKSAEPDGLVQAYADSPLDKYNVCESIYLNMIYKANKYVYVASPYLILDSEMETALCNAAQCGIDVRIVTPHIPDKWYVHLLSRSYYSQLIKSGAKIYEYTPGFMHGKMMLSDDTVASVGTCNMDYRSFYLHYECGMLFYNGSLVPALKQDFENTFKLSQIVTLEELKKLSIFKRLIRALLKMFAPLM